MSVQERIQGIPILLEHAAFNWKHISKNTAMQTVDSFDLVIPASLISMNQSLLGYLEVFTFLFPHDNLL